MATQALAAVLMLVCEDIRHAEVREIWLVSLAALGFIAIVVPDANPVSAFLFAAGRAAMVLAGTLVLRGAIADLLEDKSEDILGGGDIGLLCVSAIWLPLALWLTAAVTACLASLFAVCLSHDARPLLQARVPFVAFMALASTGTLLIFVP